MKINENSNVLILGFHTYEFNKITGDRVYSGGTEVVTENLVYYLKSKGAKVHLFCITGRREIVEGYKEFYDIEFSQKISDSDDNLLYLKKYIEEHDIKLIINSTCIDHFHNKYINKVFSKLEVPLIIYTHGSNICNPRTYIPSIADKSNAIVLTLTGHEYSDILNAGMPESRLFRINNPISIDENSNEVSETAESNSWLLNARMVLQKGVPNAVRLANACNINLDIVGKNTNKKAYAQILENIQDYEFNYLGVLPRDELYLKIQNSSFCILLPDAPEGRTLALLESMALGTPVITWDDYSYSEFVDPNRNILLKHDENFIEEFISNYLPILDNYTNIENRRALQAETIEKYGKLTYYSQLDNFISNI